MILVIIEMVRAGWIGAEGVVVEIVLSVVVFWGDDSAMMMIEGEEEWWCCISFRREGLVPRAYNMRIIGCVSFTHINTLKYCVPRYKLMLIN